MKGETWTIILITVAAIIFAILDVALVRLAGILIASPIYKSIKSKAFDADIESVRHLL